MISVHTLISPCTYNILQCCIVCVSDFRYGAGYTLQAKVMLSAPPEPPPPCQREKYSFRRIFSRRDSRIHGSVHVRRKSTRTTRHTSKFSREDSTGVASGHLGRKFSVHRLLSRAVSVFNLPPSAFDQYDTTSLNSFIREAFNDAVLLEEHQVCLNECMLVTFTSTGVWILFVTNFVVMYNYVAFF